MTTLHDRLDDAVADVSADISALTAASRRQGLGIRRRRRALTSVGSLAAATALVASGVAIAGGSDDTVAADVANPVSVGPLSGKTAPTTGNAVVAALAGAVDQAADGTFGRLQDDDTFAAFASLLFEPYGEDGPPGQVMVNLSRLGKAPYDCTAIEAISQLTDCAVRPLPHGDILRTYWEHNDTEYEAGSQRMSVQVLSPERHLIVTVNAYNTNPWANGAMRDAPVLTLDQAIEVATQPWWSLTRMPVEYVEAGERIELYEPEAD